MQCANSGAKYTSRVSAAAEQQGGSHSDEPRRCDHICSMGKVKASSHRGRAKPYNPDRDGPIIPRVPQPTKRERQRVQRDLWAERAPLLLPFVSLCVLTTECVDVEQSGEVQARTREAVSATSKKGEAIRLGDFSAMTDTLEDALEMMSSEGGVARGQKAPLTQEQVAHKRTASRKGRKKNTCAATLFFLAIFC